MITKREFYSLHTLLAACNAAAKYFKPPVPYILCEFSRWVVLLLLILAWALVGCGTTRPTAVPQIKLQPSVTPLSTSARTIPPPDPLRQLQDSIDAILADSIFIPARASIKIVSLDSDKVLYQHDSKALMNPASNIKLITSAAALFVLDTNYQYKTSVFIDNITANRGAVPNIYLKGYGDPILVTDDLDSLAYAVRRAGISAINNIIVDDSFFDDNYWGAGWTWDDESDPDAPSINALSVNSNCIKVIIVTNSDAISVFLEPNTEFVTVLNRSEIVSDSICIPLKIRHQFVDNKNTIVIDGDLYRYSQVTQKFSLRFPQFYAGSLFKESLRRAGISVSGDIVSGGVPDGIYEIARHLQPIGRVIDTMNKQSDNLAAENTLKLLGTFKNSTPGSAKNGVYAEKRFISFLGMDTTKFSIVDGSGSSRYNLLNADQVVQFLVAMNKQQRIFMMFYNSLPVAGVDGTLSSRMCSYPVSGNLHAKTGTLLGASCLSGYVQTRDGEMLAFAMMMQNFITPSSDYRQAQDRIGTLLAGFSRTMIPRTGILNKKME